MALWQVQRQSKPGGFSLFGSRSIFFLNCCAEHLFLIITSSEILIFCIRLNRLYNAYDNYEVWFVLVKLSLILILFLNFNYNLNLFQLIEPFFHFKVKLCQLGIMELCLVWWNGAVFAFSSFFKGRGLKTTKLLWKNVRFSLFGKFLVSL